MARTTLPFRVRLAQIAPALGDLRKNLQLHMEHIQAALAEGAHLVVFPELSLTGYWLHDLVPEVALEPASAPLLAPVRKASRRIDIVLGLVEKGADSLPYNSAVCFRGGQVVWRQRKVHLPTYTMFDEGRYFAPGQAVRAFPSSFGRTGMLVCEDLWHPSLTYLLARDGADLLVALSSSPGRGVEGHELASQRAWKLLGESAALFHTMFMIYVGRAGVEDGHSFGGGSFVFGPDGELLARLPVLQEDTATVELDPRELDRCRSISPLRRDARPDLVCRELQRILGQPGASGAGKKSTE